jgi:hypothetical protein
MSHSFIAVDPRLFGVVEWADATALTLYDLTAVPRLNRVEDWQEWAKDVCGDPNIAAYEPPNPTAYDDWRTWASLFNESILRSAA